jgi:hypothetical protein
MLPHVHNAPLLYNYQMSRKVKFYSDSFSVEEKIQIIALVSTEIERLGEDASQVHVMRGAMTLAESLSYDLGELCIYIIWPGPV